MMAMRQEGNEWVKSRKKGKSRGMRSCGQERAINIFKKIIVITVFLYAYGNDLEEA